ANLRLAVAAQNIDQLMSDHVLDSLTGRLEVLTGIEVIRMLVEVLTDAGGDSQTDVGVDVDLADGQLRRVTELILRNADSIRHLAAMCVDLVNKLARNGRRTVQNDREAGRRLETSSSTSKRSGGGTRMPCSLRVHCSGVNL